MTPKVVVSLGLAALISTGAAMAAWHASTSVTGIAGAGEALLPGLIDKVNTVAAIEVREGDRVMSLQRSGDGWQVLPSGYPVKPRKLQETLVGLVRLSKLEPRTSVPEKYRIIQVEDANGSGSKSRRVVLRNEAGDVIGDVVLGKAAAGYTSGEQEAQYVRLGGEAQSWLVKGSVAAGAEYKDWVDTTVMQINTGEVKSVTITQADGESLKLDKVGKTEQGHDKFAIDGLPDGIKPKDDLSVRYAATDLANVEFVDVRKAAATGAPASRAMVETDKGLKISYALFAEDGKDWLQVTVDTDGDDKAAADAIRNRVTGWQFAIADHKVKQFRKRLSDLLDMQQ
jgi:hypothetical protein